MKILLLISNSDELAHIPNWIVIVCHPIIGGVIIMIIITILDGLSTKFRWFKK